MTANTTPLGPYTMEIHDHYIAYKVGKYLIDHPGTPPRLAKRYARLAWARKLKKIAAMEARYASPTH